MLYKVHAVTVIPPLRKVSSDEKKHQSKQNPSDSLLKKNFSEVLDEACDEEERQTIYVRTSGYTRYALPYYNFINMREYR